MMKRSSVYALLGWKGCRLQRAGRDTGEGEGEEGRGEGWGLPAVADGMRARIRDKRARGGADAGFHDEQSGVRDVLLYRPYPQVRNTCTAQLRNFHTRIVL